MAGNKRGPGRPPGSKNKSKTPSRNVQETEARLEAKAKIRDEIIGIIIIAVSVFLIIALQTQAAGTVGEAIAGVMKGCLGFSAFVLPYYFIVYGIMLFLHKTIHISVKSVVYLVIIYFMIVLINAGRFTAEFAGREFAGLSKYYADGLALEGGGVLGMGAGVPLTNWIGAPGLYILSFVVIFIFTLLLVNTPVSRFFENVKRRKQRRQLEREERAAEKAREAEAQKQHLDMEMERFAAARQPVTVDMTAGQRKIMGYMSDDSRVSDGEGVSSEIATDTDTAEMEKAGKKSKRQAAEEISTAAEDIDIIKGSSAGVSASTENYTFPPLDILQFAGSGSMNESEHTLRQKAMKLEETLRSFNIDAAVNNVTQGPAVTRYEVQPNSGVKVKGIKNLADDIALNMEARSIRIEAPIPGKAAVGIEIENEKINMVTIREIIDSPAFRNAKSKITMAIGKDIAGKAIVADLKAMPHLLIAGSTGSGKSVCINSIITSILYKARPDEVKMVLIDPKVVELSQYNGIPHLLIPVVTDPAKAAAALNWAVTEMDERYKKFAEVGVRELSAYNRHVKKEPMPQIVIIIDELADLMMAAPSQVEESICRLAQKARAAGMHLIVATQRPSVDVITGLIKANIPSRIAFAVSSQVDSRTILDMVGAEKLVGRGDMLFNPLGSGKPVRVQGTFISDDEVRNLIAFVKQQGEADEAAAGDVMDSIARINTPDAEKGNRDFKDELLPDAIELVVGAGQASVSMLQRRFRIGYNRAARIIDMMEDRQIVGPQDGSRPRQVLISEEDLEVMKEATDE